MDPTSLPPNTESSPTPELAALLWKEIRAIAEREFRKQAKGHTLQPTAVANEAYIKLCESPAAQAMKWTSKEQFLAYAATAVRNVLVDHARSRKAREQRDRTLARGEVDGDRMEFDLLDLNDALERFSAVQPRGSRVIELRFFAGLTIEETKTAMGMSDFTVEKDWRLARAWLTHELGPGRDSSEGH